NFLSHVSERRSSERGHLAVPPGGKLPTKIFEMRQRVQNPKVLERARARAVHLGRIDEFVPSLVREQCEGPEFAALFKVPEDFSGDALLCFFIFGVGQLRAVLHETFLCIGRFAMNLTDETYKLLPRLAVCAAILSGINGRQFPLLIPGKRIDGLREIRGESFEFLGRSLRSAAPQIGAKVEVLHAEAVALA